MGGERRSPAQPGPASPASGTVLARLQVVVLSLVYLVPVVPSVTARAYGMVMQLTTLGQAYKVFLKFGAPQGIWPFSWPHLRAWLAQASSGRRKGAGTALRQHRRRPAHSPLLRP